MIATSEQFAAAFDVSRETMRRLEAQRALLAKWNRRINLISRGSEAAVWQRHFADSAQLWLLRPTSARHWADLGAGAGFPGLVIAAFAADEQPELRVTLVERDSRKAAFLEAAARASGLAPAVLAARVEDVPPLGADVVSARALAGLDILLDYAEKHRRVGGIGLFPKGATVHSELAQARRRWRFEAKIHPSRTDPGAAIVEIGAIARA